MAKISTKELFDRYFATRSEELARKTRCQVDKPELYEYEKKIGKQLVDMDVDEIFGLLASYKNQSAVGLNNPISYGSFDQICSILRMTFNYYIDNIEIIRNPFNDKRLKGTAAWERFSKTRNGLNNDTINKIFEELPNYYDKERANYYECIVQLFYNGFVNAAEIVRLKEDMIDFDNNIINLPGRVVHISDRCKDVLKYVHELDTVPGQFGSSFYCIPYRNGYFKFIVRKGAIDSFDDRTVTNLSQVINRTIKNATNEMGIIFNARDCFLLSFYNYLVSLHGEKKTRELILSVRNHEDANDLLKAAADFGFPGDNVTNIKKSLRNFL